MAINFPNNPAVNDTFTVGGTTFTFTGVKWETSAVVEISSDTTPSLGGALDAGTHNINNVGIITATTFSGNLTGNVTGTATTAQGLTGDPSIQVTNATVLGNLDVQGTTTTIDTAVTEVDSLAVDGDVGIGTDNTATTGFTRTIRVKGSSTSSGVSGLFAESYGGSAWFGFYSGSSTTDTPALLYPFNGALRIGTTNSVGTGGFAEKVRIGSNGSVSATGTVKTGTIDITTAGGAGSNLSGDGRLTLQFPSGGGGGVGMFSVYSGTSKNIEFLSGGSATFAGTISDSMGPLRRLGIQGASGSFTLAADHAGKLVRSTGNGSTLTIPQNVFSAGDMISIFNVSTGDNTIAEGTGATLYNTADGATGNRTLGPKGVCTILCTSTNEFIISGSQVS